MRKGADYRASLRDGRRIHVLGVGPIDDVTTHPATRAMVDDYVAYRGASAIYSAELAEQCGVSVRTLGTAVASVRGMSLHRYLRLKQLWSARAQLVKGSDAVTVTSCARANGFHHMGEFARLYRAAFHETASRTLARARGIKLIPG